MATDAERACAAESAYLRRLRRDLVRYGCEPAVLEGKTAGQLERLRRAVLTNLMGAPGSAKAG